MNKGLNSPTIDCTQGQKQAVTETAFTQPKEPSALTHKTVFHRNLFSLQGSKSFIGSSLLSGGSLWY
jgi:hypothetical protein